MNERLKESLKLLPSLPGCYIYYNKDNEIIYVGKAKNLHNRVNQYFVGSHDYKTTKLVANIVDVKSRAAGVPEVASVANGKLDIREVEGATDEYGYVEVILYSEKEAGTYAFSLYVASSEDVEAATENPDALADIDAGTYISSEYVQTAFDEKSVVELSGKYSLRDSEKKEIAAEDLNARVEWARLLREESTKVDFFDGY